MAQDEVWKAVGEAAEAHGVPIRTAYNWVKSRRLESKTAGGITLVPATQFQALAALRASGSTRLAAGTSAGTGAGNSAGTGNGRSRPAPASPAPPLEGAQAAQLFSAFERGETPTSLVQRLEIAPLAALAAWRQWVELQTAAGSRPGLDARLTDLEQTLAAVANQLAEFTNSGRLAGEVYVLRRRTEELRQLLVSLPVPQADALVCGCGQRAQVILQVRCTVCGNEGQVGMPRGS